MRSSCEKPHTFVISLAIAITQNPCNGMCLYIYIYIRLYLYTYNAIQYVNTMAIYTYIIHYRKQTHTHIYNDMHRYVHIHT